MHVPHIPIVYTALLYVLIAPLFQASAAALSVPLKSLTTSQNENGTSYPTLPVPPDFKIFQLESLGDRLNDISCLDASVKASGILALEDHDGGIPAQGWSLPNVVIEVSTQGSARDMIPRKYVMWGLWCVIEYMVAVKAFSSSIYRLEWRETPVGKLAFRPNWNTQSNVGGFVTVVPSNLTWSADNTASSTSALAPLNSVNTNVLHLKFAWIVPLSDLNMLAVFMLVISVLNDLAQYSKTDLVVNQHKYLQPAYDAAIGIVGPKDKSMLMPPWLTYEWVIRTLVQVPDKLLSEGKFMGVIVRMAVDGAVVGSLCVARPKDLEPLNGLAPDDGNVTVS